MNRSNRSNRVLFLDEINNPQCMELQAVRVGGVVHFYNESPDRLGAVLEKHLIKEERLKHILAGGHNSGLVQLGMIRSREASWKRESARCILGTRKVSLFT